MAVMPEKFIPLAIVAVGTALLGIISFKLPVSAPAEQPIGRASVSVGPSWTQETGAGLFVPACGSSGAGTSCQGGSPTVNFSWTIDGPAPNNVSCSTAAIKVNGSTIASGLPCSGSYQWNSASPNTTYSYEIVISTP